MGAGFSPADPTRLRPLERPARPQRIESRAAAEAWCRVRSATLTAFVEGELHAHEPEPGQMELGRERAA